MMKVLVVDDSRSARMIIKKELEQGHYEILEASDGQEALEIVRNNPELDLITMDVDMPNMDGYSACKAIKDMPGKSALPIVFITANDTGEDRIKGFELGATDFVTKPFQKGQLLPVIEKILMSDPVFSGAIALVVEDSDLPRAVIAKCLKEHGVEVIESCDGIEALEKIALFGERINLVVTDFEMPRMDGSELCSAIRERSTNKDVPIIFVSAMPDPDMILKLFKQGATDYLIKPFLKEELVARIRVHLETQLAHRRLKMKMAELEKLQSLQEEFMTVCAHDFRLPLAEFINVIDDLKELRHQADEDLLGIIQTAKYSGEYLTALIGEILEADQKKAGHGLEEKAVISLVDVVKSIVSTAKPLAETRKISIDIIDKSRYGDVLGNRYAMSRIFNSLISRAMNMAFNGGTVAVRIEQPENHQIAVLVEAEQYTLSHRETFSGALIEKQEHELEIVRKLVESHQGDMIISHPDDAKVCFSLLFPTTVEVSIAL